MIALQIIFAFILCAVGLYIALFGVNEPSVKIVIIALSIIVVITSIIDRKYTKNMYIKS